MSGKCREDCYEGCEICEPHQCERCGIALTGDDWDRGHCSDCRAVVILEQRDNHERYR